MSPDRYRAQMVCDQAAAPVQREFGQEALGEERLVHRVVKRPQGWVCEEWSRDEWIQGEADVSFP